MSRDDAGVVGQAQQAGLYRVDDLIKVSAGQIGPADASGEERIAGEDHFHRGEVKADGALGVAGSVDDLGRIVLKPDVAAVGEHFVGRRCLWSLDAEPGCLRGHHLEQREITFVQVDWCSGEGLQL